MTARVTSSMEEQKDRESPSLINIERAEMFRKKCDTILKRKAADGSLKPFWDEVFTSDGLQWIDDNVEAIIQKQKPHLTDSRGMALLQQAASVGEDTVATFLLRHGADPNFRSSDGQTALHVASTGDMVTLLLLHGADIDAKDYRSGTPLHQAIADVNVPVVVALVRRGANLEEDMRCGMTPLARAIVKDNYFFGHATGLPGQEREKSLAKSGYLVEFLVQAGAQLDRKDQGPPVWEMSHAPYLKGVLRRARNSASTKLRTNLLTMPSKEETKSAEDFQKWLEQSVEWTFGQQQPSSGKTPNGKPGGDEKTRQTDDPLGSVAQEARHGSEDGMKSPAKKENTETEVPAGLVGGGKPERKEGTEECMTREEEANAGTVLIKLTLQRDRDATKETEAGDVNREMRTHKEGRLVAGEKIDKNEEGRDAKKNEMEEEKEAEEEEEKMENTKKEENEAEKRGVGEETIESEITEEMQVKEKENGKEDEKENKAEDEEKKENDLNGDEEQEEDRTNELMDMKIEQIRG